jgi:hypothetical protein
MANAVVSEEPPMKTYPIKSDRNQTFAFEISNAYIGASAIADLLRQSDKVTNVKPRKPLENRGDVHIEFQYAGTDFVVWEPFGDSSRYWVGPKDDANRSVSVEDLEAVFARYQPAGWRKVVGDLLTLNLKSLFGRE